MPPNPSPEGANTSPENDNSCNPVWKRDNNNRLKHLKLNRALYAITSGRQHQPPMPKKLSQKRKHLNYKRFSIQFDDKSTKTVNSMHLNDSILTIKELLDSPILKFITLAASDCGYSGTSEYLIVNHVLFYILKLKQQQVRRIIQIGSKPLVVNLPMSIGKELSWMARLLNS